MEEILYSQEKIPILSNIKTTEDSPDIL